MFALILECKFVSKPHTHLCSENCLSGLWDHVQLLNSGGQVTGGSEVGQTHKPALSTNIIMWPIVPFVRCMGSCGKQQSHRQENSQFKVQFAKPEIL